MTNSKSEEVTILRDDLARAVDLVWILEQEEPLTGDAKTALDRLRNALAPPVRTDNDFCIQYSRMDGVHSAFVRPVAKTRQEAYRWAAWIVACAEVLPQEPGDHTFDQVLEAIKNV